MTDLLAARFQMGMSLAFHIIFAAVGHRRCRCSWSIAEWRWLRTAIAVYLELAQRWAEGHRDPVRRRRGVGHGAVVRARACCGRGFMEFAGPIIGMPFSLEGFAFFIEAIFLGIYLYGWDRVSPRAHSLPAWSWR